MFHRRCNELRLTLNLEPAAPLLVKAGDDPLDDLEKSDPAADMKNGSFEALVQDERKKIAQRTQEEQKRREQAKRERADGQSSRAKLAPDMTFVRTLRHGRQEPYLPGSSLKGVLRNRCEQLSATFGGPALVCNILDQEGKSSGKRSCTKVVESLAAPERYAAACPVCKLFGCGGLAARLAVSDAYLTAAPGEDTYTTRSGVGISRQRGAAHTGALFFLEVLQKGTFALTITLENFELWQLGLTAYALDALLQSQLPVGYGSRRGLGLMQGQVSEATLTYFGRHAHQTAAGCRLLGVARLHSSEEAQNQYRFAPENGPVTLPGGTLQRLGLRQAWTLSADGIEQMWAAGAEAWQDTMRTVMGVGDQADEQTLPDQNEEATQ